MAKILLAEDDLELNKIVTLYLNNSGYSTTSCFNGKDALDKFMTSKYDIIISDIMMPEMDGFEFAKLVRETNADIPILFMTARDDKPSKQLGFKLGIDDYLTKPFDIDELVMRVGAILRRAKVFSSSRLEVGNLIMDKDEHVAYIDGEELSLTVREFDLLFKFLSNPKKTYTRSSLMDEFWDFDSSATSRTVDVYMAKLREKTSKCDGFEIVTVHGLGYKAVLNETK